MSRYGDGAKNANPVNDGRSLLPNGWYAFRIDGAEPVNSRRSDWVGMKLELTVISHERQGGKVWHQQTLEMASRPDVQAIANEQLNSLCAALGKLGGFDHPKELKGCEFEGRVGVKKQAGYDDKNELYGWRPLDPSNWPNMAGRPGAGSGQSPDWSDPGKGVGEPVPWDDGGAPF